MSRRWFTFFILWGVALLVAPASFATSAQIINHISFANPSVVSSSTGILFGKANAHSNAEIRISGYGQLYLDGRIPLNTYGSQAGKMTLDGTDDQMMNLLSINYQADGDVVPTEATCSLDGSSDSSCNAFFDILRRKKASLLLLGMRVQAGKIRSLGTRFPEFDLCVVYQ